MSETLDRILVKYGISITGKEPLPIEIPNVGRGHLPGLFHELELRIGVEIGVQRGKFTEILCRENPEGIVYGVDPWLDYPEYRDMVSQDGFDQWRAEACSRLAGYANHRLIQKFSMEAVLDFAHDSLDWVYIDGNHMLKYVINDIVEWSNRVRPGGIISGHDYRQLAGADPHGHVYEAVNCLTACYRIQPWFVLGQKYGVEGETRDKVRSWLWVKT